VAKAELEQDGEHQPCAADRQGAFGRRMGQRRSKTQKYQVSSASRVAVESWCATSSSTRFL
jgi:hypothetical protein